MPLELRRILFSQEEALEALAKFGARGAPGVPARRGVALHIANSGTGLTFHLEEFSDRGTPRPPVRIAAETMGAALLFFCKASSIPVPRKARKSLEVDGGCIVLRVELGDFPIKDPNEISIGDMHGASWS